MLNWINAFTLCILGCITVSHLKEEGSERQSAATRSVSTNVEVSRPAPSKQSAVCEEYDVVERPEKLLDAMTLAGQMSCRMVGGRKVCTPVEILYAIWRIETGHVDGNGSASGRCSVMQELARRDEAAGTQHAMSMKRMSEVFGWYRSYGENLERLTCSCPKIVDDVDPATGEVIGKKTYGYGGCCGPFQFSGAEIVDAAIEQRLDPLTFCGGAILAAQDLVLRYERALKKGYAHGIPAWRRAISSYYGRDPGGLYYSKGLSRWKTFFDWQSCEISSQGTWIRKDTGVPCDEETLIRQWEFVRSQIVAQSRSSIRYHRSLRQ